MATPYPQGLGSMAPARLPSASPGSAIMQIGPQGYGQGAPPPPDQSEEPFAEVPEQSEVGKLIGQFKMEIELADQGRLPKEHKFIKIEKYLAGKDVNPAPEGYEESTFMYRRLPRLTQIGKEKLYKHVCPLHGKPWDVKASPRHNQNEGQENQDVRISKLKEEIEDIQEAMEMETFLDDMCEFMSDLGTAVVYGPVALSQPRLRWQNGEEVVEDADKLKPMWQIYDPKRVYPDPNAKKPEDLEYVYFHHVWSQHQIRSLQEDPSFIRSELGDLIAELPDGDWAGNLKRWELVPFPTNVSGAGLKRFLVWMRIGYLSGDALEALGEMADSEESLKDLKGFKDLDKDQRRALTESLWEIWFCDKHVLKIAKRKFQPNRLPVQFVPFRRDPTSIFGIGVGEAALDVVEMLINICRSIDDALADTSGYQAIIDAGSVENKDLRIRGRKTWLYRNKGTVRKEGPTGKPVEFFTVPSNLPALMECFKLYESMLPVVTGVSEMTTGADMGSGVRTDQMMTDVWASLEEFLRSTVGNVDRYWWKSHLHDVYRWIQEYYPDYDSYKIEADMVVSGVRGALRRELVGRKVKDFYSTMHQFGLPDWFDEIELAMTVAEGMGIESEKAVLTPKQYTEKQQMKAEQAKLQAAAGQAPANAEKEKERAHSSTRDIVVETFKALMSANPNDPATIPMMEKIFKLTGQLDDRSMAALSVRSKMLAQQYQQLGAATPQEAQHLEAPVKPDSPLDLTDAAKKEFNPVAAQGDTIPARINPQEAALLEAHGGSGAVNPATGEKHFYHFGLKDLLAGGDPSGIGQVIVGGGGIRRQLMQGQPDVPGSPGASSSYQTGFGITDGQGIVPGSVPGLIDDEAWRRNYGG